MWDSFDDNQQEMTQPFKSFGKYGGGGSTKTGVVQNFICFFAWEYDNFGGDVSLPNSHPMEWGTDEEKQDNWKYYLGVCLW